MEDLLQAFLCEHLAGPHDTQLDAGYCTHETSLQQSEHSWSDLCWWSSTKAVDSQSTSARGCAFLAPPRSGTRQSRKHGPSWSYPSIGTFSPHEQRQHNAPRSSKVHATCTVWGNAALSSAPILAERSSRPECVHLILPSVGEAAQHFFPPHDAGPAVEGAEAGFRAGESSNSSS